MPRSLEDVLRAGDYLVTVCDNAHEELDRTTRARPDDGATSQLHWSVPDPVRAGTSGAFDHDLRRPRPPRDTPRAAPGRLISPRSQSPTPRPPGRHSPWSDDDPHGRHHRRDLDMARRLTAELVGTALLVTVVVGSGIAAQRLSPATSASSCSRTPPRPSWA